MNTWRKENTTASDNFQATSSQARLITFSRGGTDMGFSYKITPKANPGPICPGGSHLGSFRAAVVADAWIFWIQV